MILLRSCVLPLRPTLQLRFHISLSVCSIYHFVHPILFSLHCILLNIFISLFDNVSFSLHSLLFLFYILYSSVFFNSMFYIFFIIFPVLVFFILTVCRYFRFVHISSHSFRLLRYFHFSSSIRQIPLLASTCACLRERASTAGEREYFVYPALSQFFEFCGPPFHSFSLSLLSKK